MLSLGGSAGSVIRPETPANPASTLATRPKILITRASVDPGRELNGRSQQSHLFGDVDVAGPVGPSSRVPAFLAVSESFPKVSKGLPPWSAQTQEGTPHGSLRACFSRAPGCEHPTGRRTDHPDDRHRRAGRRQD